MKKSFLLFVITIIFFKAYSQQSDPVKNYINTYKELAINEMLRTGVPASITLAQGILESQAGQSDLVKESNNHFGIKCKAEWTGSKFYHDDDSKAECFRGYQNAEESYRDHSDFLKNRPNYAFLFQLDPTDYEGWAKGLKIAGYATEPDYPQALIKLIVTNHLQDYTLLALQKKQNGNQTSVAVNASPINNSQTQPEFISAISTSSSANQNDAEQQTNSSATVAGSPYPAGVFEINETKVVYAIAGTSLFALATIYHVSYEKILDFNELEKVDILPAAQLIYLEKKARKGSTDFHVVNSNETIEDISRSKGVRLESLLEFNHLSKGGEPAAGEKIFLRFNAPQAPKLIAAVNTYNTGTK